MTLFISPGDGQPAYQVFDHVTYASIVSTEKKGVFVQDGTRVRFDNVRIDRIPAPPSQGGTGGCPVVYEIGEEGMKPVNNVLNRSFQFSENRAARTTDLLVLSSSMPGGDGRYRFELREDEPYYSAFDAVELDLFDVPDGMAVVSTTDARTLAYAGDPRQASSVVAVEGIPDGRALSPGEAIHGLAGSVIEYEWADLPPSARGVVLMEPNFKINPPCGCMPCDDCEPHFAPTGRRLNSGLLVEHWRDGGWQFVGDLVPRLDWERVAVELPESPGGNLRIRIRWEGTHGFRMVRWVPEASEVEPSHRLQPLEAQHSRLGSLGNALTGADGVPALLTPGEVISFGFEAPSIGEGTERHLALRFTGRYSNSLEGLGVLVTVGIGSVASLPRVTAITLSGTNPFNQATAWKLDLAARSPVSLRVYDANGRLVREVLDQQLEAGVHTLRWDGRNDQGQAVGSGVYFWYFDGGGLRRTHKFVVLK